MDDVDKLVDFLGEHFLSDENKATANAGVQVEEICVKRIVVYPVKGLGGMDVEQWKIGPNGLSQDRRFSVIELGVKRAISLKKYADGYPRLDSQTCMLPFVLLLSGLYHCCLEIHEWRLSRRR